MSDTSVAARGYQGPRPTCDLYLRGHLVHWVQAQKAAEHKFSWGRLEAVDKGIVTVHYLDRIGRYRTHDTAELGFYAVPGDKIGVCEPYGVLRYDFDARRTLLIGVADPAAPWEPCRYEPRADHSRHPRRADQDPWWLQRPRGRAGMGRALRAGRRLRLTRAAVHPAAGESAPSANRPGSNGASAAGSSPSTMAATNAPEYAPSNKPSAPCPVQT